MISLTYERNVVLALFAQGSGKLDPKAEDIAGFDRELRDANDTALVEVMTGRGIPVDVPTKSTILLYSFQMAGEDPPAKIRNACTFFLNTQTL